MRRWWRLRRPPPGLRAGPAGVVRHQHRQGRGDARPREAHRRARGPRRRRLGRARRTHHAPARRRRIAELRHRELLRARGAALRVPPGAQHGRMTCTRPRGEHGCQARQRRSGQTTAVADEAMRATRGLLLLGLCLRSGARKSLAPAAGLGSVLRSSAQAQWQRAQAGLQARGAPRQRRASERSRAPEAACRGAAARAKPHRSWCVNMFVVI